MITTVEKSVKNYIEWYSQSTKRLDVGGHYAGIIIHCIHCINCIHCVQWLSASKMTCVWVISVEDNFLHGLSASKMTHFWIISVEDDLFSGYQRRR